MVVVHCLVRVLFFLSICVSLVLILCIQGLFREHLGLGSSSRSIRLFKMFNGATEDATLSEKDENLTLFSKNHASDREGSPSRNSDEGSDSKNDEQATKMHYKVEPQKGTKYSGTVKTEQLMLGLKDSADSEKLQEKEREKDIAKQTLRAGEVQTKKNKAGNAKKSIKKTNIDLKFQEKEKLEQKESSEKERKREHFKKGMSKRGTESSENEKTNNEKKHPKKFKIEKEKIENFEKASINGENKNRSRKGRTDKDGKLKNASTRFPPKEDRLARPLQLTLAAHLQDEKQGAAKGYLIYRCDGGRLSFCGGWADRVKGMMAAFLIANLTGRAFKAEILDPPCDLSQLVVPNKVNWSLPRSFHSSVLDNKTLGVKYINMMDNMGFRNNLHNINFTRLLGENTTFTYFKANLNYMRGFQQSKLYQEELSWMRRLTDDQMQAAVFKFLLKPSRKLENRLATFYSTHRPTKEHKLVCAHVRMGSNPTLRDSVIRHVPGDLSIVWKFLKRYVDLPNHKIFLMSDSAEVIKNGTRIFKSKLVSSDGPILHVDKAKKFSRTERCEGLSKVVFEQRVLIGCDVLLISKSGLSRMSAFVRGTEDGLFCFVGRTIVKCAPSELSDLYKVKG